MGKRVPQISVVITHTDIDGIGGAASYIRLKKPEKYEVLFTEPEELPSVLEYVIDRFDIYIKNLAIIDLAPNSSTIDKIRLMLKRLINDLNAEIEWFDHHIWNESWEKSIRELGVKLYRNTDTCATGVVINILEGSNGIYNSLKSTVCSADLWRFDDPRSPWLNRLISVGKSDAWRYIMLSKLIKASNIDEVIEWGKKYIIDQFDKELRLYKYYRNRSRIFNIDRIKIVAIVKKYREIGTSQLAHYLLTQSNSDIAVIIHRNGAISFRSNKCDVRAIAIKLGGGGHKPAAGAFIKIPSIIRFLSLLNIYAPLYSYIIGKISRVIKKIGCKKIIN